MIGGRQPFLTSIPNVETRSYHHILKTPVGVGGWWCFLSMVIVVKLGEQSVHVLVPVGYRVEMHVHVPTHACSILFFF